MIENHKNVRGKRRNGSGGTVMVLVVLTLIAAAVTLLRTGVLELGNAGESILSPKSEEVVKNDGTISIPGFESIVFTADTKKQKVALSNPAENNCLFRITLSLEDGTELWTSELIKPGKKSAEIRLNEPLPAGTYPNAVLRYQCFRNDTEQTPLNGASTKLTIIVR